MKTPEYDFKSSLWQKIRHHPFWGTVVIIGGTIIVSVPLWFGVGFLWYYASGWIKFVVLLATCVVALLTLIGTLGPVFLNNVWKSLSSKHSNRGRLFCTTVIITNGVALLLCLATIFWGFDFWGFDPYTHLGWSILSTSLRAFPNCNKVG